MIEDYPKSSAITLSMRPVLHPLFQSLAEGISEFTFANLFLFQEVHGYQISKLSQDLFVIAGRDGNRPFFLLPFGLPQSSSLSTKASLLYCRKNTRPSIENRIWVTRACDRQRKATIRRVLSKNIWQEDRSNKLNLSRRWL